MRKRWTGVVGCVLLACCLGLSADDIPVLTVCEALIDLPRFDGKSVIIVGRMASTDEGSWISETCGKKIVWDKNEFDPTISTSYVRDRVASPPDKPVGFAWDESVLRQKLEQVKMTTKLRDSNDRWVAIFGRLETKQPGYGHLGGAPGQLISRQDAYSLK